MTQLKTLCLAGLTACLLSACGGGGGSDQDQVAAMPGPIEPLVIAHRGASGYLPEHTQGGYELAIKLKADYIEPDLQFTKDGQLVAMHDETLTRTTNVASLFALRNGAYRVSDFTLAEIKTLTVQPVGGAATSYPGFTPSTADPFRVPTFQEVVDLAKKQSALVGRKIGIYPEAKQADPAMEDAILTTLGTNGYRTADDAVFIQSFSDATLRSMRTKQNAQNLKIPMIVLGAAVMDGSVAKMGIMTSGGVTALSLTDVAGFADGLGVVINYDSYGYPVTAEFIKQAHAAGLKVHGWTFANTDAVAARTEYTKYLGMGMDGMFSNYADLAVAARDAFLAARK